MVASVKFNIQLKVFVNGATVSRLSWFQHPEISCNFKFREGERK